MGNKQIKRYLYDIAFDDEFGRQMRFITGPRQCGKTTMSMQKLETEGCTDMYFNWDDNNVKQKYRNDPGFLPKTGKSRKKWVCFDEIHKVPKWKNILKGIFDTREKEYNFIITGSARLDAFRKSGDSLAGRYFLFRLNPVILAEYNAASAKHITPESSAVDYIRKNIDRSKTAEHGMEELLMHSGFPEPLLKGSDKFTRLWNEGYFERVIKEDMRDLSSVHFLQKAADLVYLLPAKVGSPLSVDSLVEDLEINHRTVRNYVNHLMLNYLIFDIAPYTGTIKRLNKKARKVYFYNYSIIPDDAAKFENFVAVELKTRTDLWNSSTADKYDLYYIRNREKKETDFLITRNNKPYLMAEVKLSDLKIEQHHRHFSQELGKIPVVQIVKKSGVLKTEAERFFVVSADRFFA